MQNVALECVSLNVLKVASASQMQKIPLTEDANALTRILNQRVRRLNIRIGFKTSPQTKYDICARNIEITRVAQFLDKLAPNKILVPASLLTKKVNLSLKKKTIRQIISSSGLLLKS